MTDSAFMVLTLVTLAVIVGGMAFLMTVALDWWDDREGRDTP